MIHLLEKVDIYNIVVYWVSDCNCAKVDQSCIVVAHFKPFTKPSHVSENLVVSLLAVVLVHDNWNYLNSELGFVY